MTPFTALYRKEFRQQFSLAACMVLFCFVLQLGMAMMQLVVSHLNPDFLAVGLLVTALFAGAAAALSFSSEKDDRTFDFLRSLPVSAKSIVYGKCAWIISGTAGVLAATSLLAGMWVGLTSQHGLGAGEAFAVFGVGIAEALVWGCFWSPRCKTQIAALLATYFCASIASYAAASFCAENFGDVLDAYIRALPIRLLIVVAVAIFATRGMARWFEFSVQKKEKSAGLKFSNSHLVLPGKTQRMPNNSKRVRSPFFSLLCQSTRQSRTLMLLGLGMVSVLLMSCYFMHRAYTTNHAWISEAFDLVMPGILFVLFYLIFCGSIFAADQKNESYRFLSRCGIAPGKIWWSRIVAFFLPALCINALCAFMILASSWNSPHTALGPLDALKLYNHLLLGYIVTFFIPFAVGSFLSISMRSPIVAVTLTGLVSMCVYFWMLLGMNLFDCNPLWSTLPICLAFLVASRMRCDDWLRERRTWRGRWKVFSPVMVTLAAICIAIPPIRIYSVPYISMEKLESEYVFHSVRKDRDGNTPEERKAQFDEMRKKLSEPLSADGEGLFIGYLYTIGYRHDEKPTPETMKARCQKLEKTIKEMPTYDAWLLKLYEIDYRRTATRWFYPPWEKTRYLRRLNEALVFALQYNDNDAWSWDAEKEWRYFFEWQPAFFNCFAWEWVNASPYSFYSRSRSDRMALVTIALQAWLLEHDAMPDTLDALVELGYLTEIPTDPKTGERMAYFPKPDWETMKKHVPSLHMGGTKIEEPVPFVKLGDATRVLGFARD